MINIQNIDHVVLRVRDLETIMRFYIDVLGARTEKHQKILGLYQSGDLKLDEIITRTYTLDEVNEGYDDLLAGKNVRGVVVHEH